MNKATAVSSVLLHIDKPLQDEIVTESGIKFFLDGSYDKNWNATVTATIAHLPSNVHQKHKHILDNLQIGDEVAISYQIVSDLDFKSDAPRFMPTTEGDDQMREWVNGFGFKLAAYALPGKISRLWVGIYQDKAGRLIDGVQGTEHDLNRWLAQFPMGKTDIYSFNNFFEYNKADYWRCDIEQVFAKKKDGHLIAVGDRIICKPVEEEVPEEVKQSLGYSGDLKVRFQDRGRIISGGKEKGLKKDQIISFNPAFLERYDFWGKQYYLINQDRVLGIWNKN